ncbi:probable ATP-dependent RNA helicase DDX56 [Anopheles maculipalpis]|uniref:probable ATP-dependent RNA helicase DDX56 n=1 Tax=Anopheles maculipalpis TaxID=1496333 RepID=UPI0021596DAC|nr:probable ATP-dependent RNA helicase DDX56 [Anopheles maculipalpis]
MDEPQTGLNFHELELDDRLLRDIARLGWISPTLVQEKAIPFLLEGKDVLIRARTGSGKTAAFAIPIIQNVLRYKREAEVRETTVLVMAPSQDLCHQIAKVFANLTYSFGPLLRIVDLSSKEERGTHRHLLAERPDIVISTPARLRTVLADGTLNVRESLRCVTIDEADLMFTFGFEKDLQEVLKHFPPVHQSVLCSATLEEDVVKLKQLVLHNPVILKLEEPHLAVGSQLKHYQIQAEEVDKASILYTALKLKLIQGKCIIFVKSVDRCYRLKLFLEQFGIRSCILNSELPIKIRCHTVNQFNQGVYDTIIASDEQLTDDPKLVKKKNAKKPSTKEVLQQTEAESSVSRGIDFQCVSCVVNFDFPSDINAYIHRAGRTARGKNNGSVLSFVSVEEQEAKARVEEFLQTLAGDAEFTMEHFSFNLDEVEAFRYRAKDAWRAITKFSIREARIKELKMEIFNSEKLKSFFEENPRDFQTLRHDRPLHTVHVQEHMGDVPEYLVPPALKPMVDIMNAKRKQKMLERHAAAKKRRTKADNPLLVDGIDYKKISM